MEQKYYYPRLDSAGFDISEMPNDIQMKALKKYLENFQDDVLYVDISAKETGMAIATLRIYDWYELEDVLYDYFKHGHIRQDLLVA